MTEQLTLDGSTAPPTLERSAVISACGLYRYELRRVWSPLQPLALICGANPSTADGKQDDATIRRETGFATRWGCGGFVKVNLLAFRATQPRDVPRDASARGPENDHRIALALAEAHVGLVVAAWGDCLARHPFEPLASARFLALCERAGRPVQCLGTTWRGAPMHPLARVKGFSYATPLRPFDAPLAPTAERV